MLAILIVLIMSMAVIAVSYNTYLNMANSSGQISKLLEEKRLLNDWTNSLQFSMRPFGLDRSLVVPNGETNSDIDYMLPPASINLSAKNAWGKDIIYCPFSSNTSAGTDTLKAGGGNTYSASLMTGVDGIEYVYSISNDDPTDTDLLAAIISPIPAKTSPSCLDIRFDSITGTYYVVNYDGVVHAVKASALVVSNQAKSVIASQEGDIADSLVDWSAMVPDVTNIQVPSMQSGAYQMRSMSFTSAQSSKNKVINLTGEGTSQSVVSGDGSSIVFENVSVSIKDLTFGEGTSLTFVNSDVTLDNVVLHNIYVEGSKVFAKGDVKLVASTRAIEIKDSNYSGRSTSLIISREFDSFGLHLSGSDISADSLVIENSISNGVSVLLDKGSSLITETSLVSNGSYLDSVLSLATDTVYNADSVSITINNPVDAFMFTQGDVLLHGVLINFNSSVDQGIILGLNSETVLNNVQIGSATSRPLSGVVDLGGAKFIGGFGTIINSSSTCWSGDIFATASPNTSGSSSVPTDQSYKSANRSVWACNI